PGAIGPTAVGLRRCRGSFRPTRPGRPGPVPGRRRSALLLPVCSRGLRRTVPPTTRPVVWDHHGPTTRASAATVALLPGGRTRKVPRRRAGWPCPVALARGPPPHEWCGSPEPTVDPKIGRAHV